VTSYEYDTFKRLDQVIKPGIPQKPTVPVSLQQLGTLNQQEPQNMQNLETPTKTRRVTDISGASNILMAFAG